jgi:hypothetical protein
MKMSTPFWCWHWNSSIPYEKVVTYTRWGAESGDGEPWYLARLFLPPPPPALEDVAGPLVSTIRMSETGIE